MNTSTKSTTKQKKALRLAIAALILTLQLTSCQSSKVKSEAPQFSEPYDTEGNLIVTYDVNTDKVSMPLWYWKKIVRYAVDVQGVEEE